MATCNNFDTNFFFFVATNKYIGIGLYLDITNTQFIYTRK